MKKRMESEIKSAKSLVEALPYINKFQGSYFIIKYGGSIMLEEEAKNRFCEQVTLLKTVGINTIIVHGGGKEISRWLAKVGKETEFIDGMRVTDSETMEITEMVLTGKVRNDLVAHINRYKASAVGISGKDAEIFKMEKLHHEKDLGLVGNIVSVDSRLLKLLCEAGYIPVISSVGISKDGETYNINADSAAGKVAESLNAEKLVLLTDVDGLIISNEHVQKLGVKDAEELLSHKDVASGMLPKLTCCVSAVKNGVKSAHIINGTVDYSILLETFTDSGIGTVIT